MLLDVEFRYDAQVRLRRKRNPVKKTYRDRVTVEIADLRSQDAPVALRATHLGQTTDYRVHDGRLFKPLLVSTRANEAASVRDAAWLAAVAQNSDQTLRHPLAAGSSRYTPGVPGHLGDDADVADIIQSDRDAVARTIEGKAASVICVDGDVWTAVSEPVFVVGRYSHGSSLEVVEYNDGLDPFRVWRLNDVETLLAVNEDLDRKTVDEAVEVFLPEALSHPAEEHAILALAKLLREAMQRYLPIETVAYFSAFAELRDAGSSDNPDLDALAQGCREALVLYDVADRLGDYRRDLFHGVLSRWDQKHRSSDLSFGL